MLKPLTKIGGLFRSLGFAINPDECLYYFGSFDNWDNATKKSLEIKGNYESNNIIDQVEQATIKVIEGNAVYEQDGICFYEPNNNYELIASLEYAFVKEGHISVLDFGGALGSTYFRYKELLQEMRAEWSVVEQKHYVTRGKEKIPGIDFFYTADECFKERQPNVLLLSSVLGYLGEPYEVLSHLLSFPFKYIIIEETAFFPENDKDDTVMLQHVPAAIYEAVYPIHIFNYRKMIDFFLGKEFSVKWEWVFRGGSIPIKKGIRYQKTVDKGMLLIK